MKKLVAIIALFVASEAGAQGLNPYPPGVKPKSKTGTLLDIAFSSAGCQDSGSPTGLTFARNSSATYVDANGIVQTCAADKYRVAVDGLAVEGATTNLLKYSEDIAESVWNNCAQIGINSNVTATKDPADGNTADKMYDTAVPGFHHCGQKLTVNMTSNNYSASVFVKAAGRTRGEFVVQDAASPYPKAGVDFNLTDKTVTEVALDGGTVVAGSGFIQELGSTGWFRIGFIGRTGKNSSTNNQIILLANSSGSMSYTGDGSSGLYVWGFQLEGTLSTSYIATTTTSVQRYSDDVSVSTPPLASYPNWSLSADYKKYWVDAWTRGTLFSLDGDTTSDGNNSSRLTMGASDLVWTVIDNTPTTRTVTVSTPGYAVGSSQTFLTKNANGTLSMTCGGSACGTASGTLNAFSTTPSTIYLGRKSDSTDYFNGWIKNLKITSP